MFDGFLDLVNRFVQSSTFAGASLMNARQSLKDDRVLPDALLSSNLKVRYCALAVCNRASFALRLARLLMTSNLASSAIQTRRLSIDKSGSPVRGHIGRSAVGWRLMAIAETILFR
jgi:hypothetical protein